MKFLNIHFNLWLKGLHILFTCFWLGAVFSVVIIFLLTSQETNTILVVSNSELMKKLDFYIIIPFSGLSYLSGLLLSLKTNWGFFKYKWIVCKLIVSTLLILFGVFFLAPWIYKSQELVLSDYSEYQQIQMKLGISMIIQFFIILLLVFISAIKPWKKVK